MRGKVYTAVKNAVDKRITPAYAGKSLHNACQIILSQDHPRLCGEKLAVPCVVLVFTGSPPPMRGKGNGAATFRITGGITPAYAGKSTTWYRPDIEAKDHPRLCGEKQNQCKQ